MRKKLLMLIITGFVIASASLAAPNAEDAPEIHLLIDVSASMKKTDPQNLRIPAIRIFNKLTSQKAFMSISTFSTKLNEILPLNQVNQDYQKRFDRIPQAIKSNGEWTDLVKALEGANKHWTKNARYIVLISDGKLDIGPDALDAQSFDYLQKNTLPALQKNKVQVFTIGLSAEADKNILNQIAEQTNGIAQFVNDSQDLDHVLYTIFLAIVKPEGTVINKDSDQKRNFIIDKAVSDLTLILEMNPGDKDLELKKPDGQKVNINHESILIDRYRFLKFSKPMTGKWELSGQPLAVERALVLTDLNLVSNLISGSYFSDEQLWAMGYLTEKNQLLDSDLIKNTTKMTVELQQDQNNALYELPYQDKGKFSKTIQLNLPAGVYNLFWKATSPAMTREHQFIVTIRENPFEQALDNNKNLTILLSDPKIIDPDSVRIRLSDANLQPTIVRNSNQYLWQINLSNRCQDDEKPQDISPIIEGVTTQGRPVLFLMPKQTLSCIKPPKPLISSIASLPRNNPQAEPVVEVSNIPKMPVASIAKPAKPTLKKLKPKQMQNSVRPHTSLIMVCFMLLFSIIITIGVFFSTRMIFNKKINNIKGQL